MATERLELTDKQIASELVERMPDTATLDEIREELAIAKAIRAGIADADAGRIMSHEEAVRRSATWITPQFGPTAHSTSLGSHRRHGVEGMGDAGALGIDAPSPWPPDEGAGRVKRDRNKHASPMPLPFSSLSADPRVAC